MSDTVYIGNHTVLYHGDCLDILPAINTRVDLVFVDLPYGTTRNRWDVIIPFDSMWDALSSVRRDSTPCVFTSAEPFTSKLVVSNTNEFKYDMIWKKTVASGQLNVKHRPLRIHENIVVFYRRLPTYNEQKTRGEPYKITRSGEYREGSYGRQANSTKVNTGYRHANSVITVPNPRIREGHPTQKPVELVNYFVKMFTNEGDTVLDFCMGSGTTGVSAVSLGRKFIGVELDRGWFDVAARRIADVCWQ